MKSFLTVLLTTALFGNAVQAATYKYNELMIKDYDEMLGMVQTLAKKARQVPTSDDDDKSNDSESIQHLREAMKLILSRPDSDNMVAKLIPEIRRDLVGFSAYEDTISSIVSEALEHVKNEKAAVTVQSTSLFVLENALAQIRPEAPNNQDMRRIVQRIRDAKIDISDDILKDRKLRGMFTTKNPSDIAKDLLKTLEKQDKEKAKQKAKEKAQDKPADPKKKVLSDE